MVGYGGGCDRVWQPAFPQIPAAASREAALVLFAIGRGELLR
jgi:hypothetical protein